LPREQSRLARFDGTVFPGIFDGGPDNLEIRIASMSQDNLTVALELWSPRTKEGPRIVVMRSDGSQFRFLTAQGDKNHFPSLSPDGKRVVYQVRGAENGLRIKSLVDGNVSKLTEGTDIFPFGHREATVSYLWASRLVILRSIQVALMELRCAS
jgi:hypothetical protein